MAQLLKVCFLPDLPIEVLLSTFVPFFVMYLVSSLVNQMENLFKFQKAKGSLKDATENQNVEKSDSNLKVVKAALRPVGILHIYRYIIRVF